jgi:hypothetical protein
MSELICQEEKRREGVRRHENLNGLDYLEVDLNPGGQGDEARLTVYFLGKSTITLDRTNVVIEGGRRTRDIVVKSVDVHQYKHRRLDDFMEVIVHPAGDFSTYTLRVVKGRDENGAWLPHPDFDPRYDRIDFNFKIDCPSDLDCAQEPICPSQAGPEPEIDYLAKDYSSFRQLILDRLALVMPEWKERHIPDLGITLVELLAYVGDHLSYYHDAVATEAYLGTARLRTSVRRHVRLVDYLMHEGCNARTWVHVHTTQDLDLDPNDVFFTTKLVDFATILKKEDLPNKPGIYESFEPMTDELIELYQSHSEIKFYSWGDAECCLPRGATTATLVGKWVGETTQELAKDSVGERKGLVEDRSFDTPLIFLQKGSLLVFEEMKGPTTGNEADADPAHRHAVRLTDVRHVSDPLDPNRHLTEIEWSENDALPFPLCLSAPGPAPDCVLIENITVARGNIVLVDHGLREQELLGVVSKKETVDLCESEGVLADTAVIPERYHPKLTKAPLTFAEPVSAAAPASKILQQDVRQALPAIELRGIPAATGGNAPMFSWEDLEDPSKLAKELASDSSSAVDALRSRLSDETVALLEKLEAEQAETSSEIQPSDELERYLRYDLERLPETWSPVRDLLGSGSEDRHFVVEVDDEGQARLRFGDGETGRRPAAGMAFRANYRVGNGLQGNVGAKTIAHLVTRKSALNVGVAPCIRNPFAAIGGTAPESVAEVKLIAPQAFLKEMQRAITADDYARIAEREFKGQVQRASATLRWNGSWYEVLVAIDPFGREEADTTLLDQISQRLYRYRRIGHDVSVKSATRVPLDIAMTVCVLPGYLRGHVEAELLDVFSNRMHSSGRFGFFHPDNLSFGEGVQLSKLVAAAQAVPGVESVLMTRFQRLNELPNNELEGGILRLAPLEIARLDNDPSFPEHGRLVFDMRGGR